MNKNVLNPMLDKSFKENLKLPFNFQRLKYLLNYYDWSVEKLLKKLNTSTSDKNKLKTRNLIKEEDLKNEKIKYNLLKKIDNIFKEGLSFFTQKENIKKSKTQSIFFRKNISTSLNFKEKKTVRKFENKRLDCENLAQSIDYNIKRIFKKYDYKTQNAKSVSKEIRKKFKEYEKTYLKTKFFQEKNQTIEKERKYLKTLFEIIEENNIFVFEQIDYHQERWNNSEKLNIDGFFITPHMIVLKKQKSIRREIFTLLHEFAHYLINEEEVEEVKYRLGGKATEIEKWCNEFAFYFNLSSYEDELKNLPNADINNNYLTNEIQELYEKTFLSYSSLYTDLKSLNKISEKDYSNKLKEIEDNFKRKKDEEKIEFEKKKKEFERKNPDKKFFVKRIAHESTFYNKLIEINQEINFERSIEAF